MDWLRNEGARQIRITTGRGKHPKLNFVLDGEAYRVPISQSPSDHRATKNAIQQLQRKIAGRERQAA
jgi:hypothetical protein